MSQLTSIHPFPARMAPEIIIDKLKEVPKNSMVVDPMSGSGTVLRAAVEEGLDCLGFDTDPLAVLMGKVWTRPIPDGLSEAALKAVQRARIAKYRVPDWHADCPETLAFAEFWFERRQYEDLSKLICIINAEQNQFSDALKLCLSRLIITKERGASIARDTSHSRPHRVFFNNDFDVFSQFIHAAKRVEIRLAPHAIKGRASVKIGDARKIEMSPNCVDAVITSPPYLNAIDYMRGHRLALIWLGYRLPELRKIRTKSIGSEASIAGLEHEIIESMPILKNLENRHRNIVQRYAQDIEVMLSELKRILKPGGLLLLVVGNSVIKETNVSNAHINVLGAQKVGFNLRRHFERELPMSSRYLPVTKVGNPLSKRMRTETVLEFIS